MTIVYSDEEPEVLELDVIHANSTPSSSNIYIPPPSTCLFEGVVLTKWKKSQKLRYRPDRKLAPEVGAEDLVEDDGDYFDNNEPEDLPSEGLLGRAEGSNSRFWARDGKSGLIIQRGASQGESTKGLGNFEARAYIELVDPKYQRAARRQVPVWKTVDMISDDDSDAPRPKRSGKKADYSGADLTSNRPDDEDFDAVESFDNDVQDEVIVIDTDDEEFGAKRASRGSGRKTKTQRSTRDKFDAESIEESDDSIQLTSSRKRKALSSVDSDYDEFLENQAQSSDDEMEEIEEVLTMKHRDICGKCNMKPAQKMLIALNQKRSKKGYKKRSKFDELLEDEEDLIEKLAGWVQCKRCSISLHWGCLTSQTRHDLLVADKQLPVTKRQMPSGRLRLDKTLVLKCDYCKLDVTKDCLTCLKDSTEDQAEDELLFRCMSCKRCAHYKHLQPLEGEDLSPNQLAHQYQEGNVKTGWKCNDCRRLPDELDCIIAWRYTTPEVKEKLKNKSILQQQLPREYLVKFKYWGFRHVTWVRHDYVCIRYPLPLRYFLEHGSKINIKTETDLANGPDELADEEDAALAVDADADQLEDQDERPKNSPDAREKLPAAWSKPDRILDAWFLKSDAVKLKAKANRIESPEPESDTLAQDFVKPNMADLIHIDQYERRHGRLTKDDAEKVVSQLGWVYVKWQDLQYEAACNDAPISPNSTLYPAFLDAFRNYLYARTVKVPVLTDKEAKRRDARDSTGYKRLMGKQPECVQNGTLMGFQNEGLDWLMNSWWNLKSVILADDMGLGKTVQIAAFLGLLGSDAWHTYPMLVVVPNSTLQNWLREFAKWVPHLRVVPLQGSKASRDIIRKYEMFTPSGDLKCHVVLATYEIVVSQKDFSILSNKVPRWEVLVVDEASRLKSQTNLITRKLTALKPVHKVLLTGTPLNNTVRELLNLMYFLDPEEWHNLDELEKHYENMTEELAKELRERIAPYMLRRRKEDVLDLPPKNEIIVPLTMRPLQRQVYKSVLEKNADLMQALTQATVRGGPPLKVKAAHNILMQLRKCLQHPFLNTPELEDRSLTPSRAHQALIDASCKLGFLKTLLPKLKAKGHRILLFSQFVIALNIIEDFCDGEGHKVLRLDGTTPQEQRQRDIDTFNAPDSEHFLYLISTRAGGMGINLATADTVIVHDLDFNPHQDMQAIARAYRYGQKRKVLVMRLMTIPTVEERMMQIAKRKLVLDHLIVQTKDDDDGSGNLASILLDGARAIIEGAEIEDATYDDQAMDELIGKLEAGEEERPKESAKGFVFAPVFDNKKGKLKALDENRADEAQDPDFWANVVKRANEEQLRKETEEHGRGKRRRAKVDVLPDKGKGKLVDNGNADSDGSVYEFKENDAESDIDADAKDAIPEDREHGAQKNGPKGIVEDQHSPSKRAKKTSAKSSRLNKDGQALKKTGDRMGLAFNHIKTLQALVTSMATMAPHKIRDAMVEMTDPNSTDEKRMMVYLELARHVDMRLQKNGQLPIYGIPKTVEEVRPMLSTSVQNGSTFSTARPNGVLLPPPGRGPVRIPKYLPPAAPVTSASSSGQNGPMFSTARPNGVHFPPPGRGPVRVSKHFPPAPPPAGASTAKLCEFCGAEEQHGACLRCVAGIQTQMRKMEDSQLDSPEDKAKILEFLGAQLQKIMASATSRR